MRARDRRRTMPVVSRGLIHRRVVGCTAALCVACGAAAPTPQPSTEAALNPIPDELTMLIPGRPDWVVRMMPTELLAQPAFEMLLAPVLTESWRDRFQLRTNVRPEQIQDLVYAGYGERGFVVIARAPASAPEVARATGMRMTPVEVSSDEPLVRRIGHLGPNRREVAALGSDVLLYAGGEVGRETAQIMEWVRSSEQAMLHRRLYTDAPVQLLRDIPLGIPTETPIGLVLADQQTLHVSVSAQGSVLNLSADLGGSFPTTVADNLRSWLASIARSDLGRAFGINTAVETLEITSRESNVQISLSIDAAAVAHGVELVFAEDWRELLRDPV